MSHFVSILILMFLLISQTNSQEEMYLYHKCIGPNYPTNTSYQRNLKNSLASLSSLNNIPNGVHYRREYGGDNDTANVIALCRGDIRQTSCIRCIRFSIKDLPTRCPFTQEAIVWYDDCMLRFSNRILQLTQEPPEFSQGYDENAPVKNWFSQVVAGLLSKLQQQASLGDVRQKFATADAEIGKQRIYGLVQCSPDLLQSQCFDCVNQSFVFMAANVSKSQKLGGRVYGPSCIFRYDTTQFYETATTPPAGTNNDVPTQGTYKLHHFIWW